MTKSDIKFKNKAVATVKMYIRASISERYYQRNKRKSNQTRLNKYIKQMKSQITLVNNITMEMLVT